MENIYEAPKADLVDAPHSEHGRPFFVTSLRKLILLYMFTMGLYVVYWGYKQWDSQRLAVGEKIYPVLRAVFLIFFTHSLFSLINKRLELQGQPNWRYGSAPTLFVVFAILASVVNYVTRNSQFGGLVALALTVILLVLQLWPLVTMQRQANLASLDTEGARNSSLSGWNWAFIVFGGVFWLMAIAGFILIELGLAEG
jgi:hypothetical protein